MLAKLSSRGEEWAQLYVRNYSIDSKLLSEAVRATRAMTGAGAGTGTDTGIGFGSGPEGGCGGSLDRGLCHLAGKGGCSGVRRAVRLAR